MSIGTCWSCGQYGGHTPSCKGVAERKQRLELAELRDKVAAQRKVLEQALEALDLSWPMRGRYISTTEFEADCAKHQAAITAIQEQLK